MDADWYHWSMEIARYIPLKSHLQSSWKHGELWPWMTSSPWWLCRGKAYFFLPVLNTSLCKEIRVLVTTSPWAPPYPIMQKPVSNLEGFFMGFQFSLLPKSRIPPNSSLVKLKPQYEQGTVSLGNLTLEKSILTNRPGKEWPVLSCSAHNFTKLHLKFFATSRALCKHQLILVVPPCRETLK